MVSHVNFLEAESRDRQHDFAKIMIPGNRSVTERLTELGLEKLHTRITILFRSKMEVGT